MCDQIEPNIYKKIVEGIVGQLEGELKRLQFMQKEIKDIKENFLQELLETAKHLTRHASEKNRKFYIGITNLDRHFSTFEQDTEGHWCRHSTICPGLSKVSKHLQSVKKSLEPLSGNELHTEKMFQQQRGPNMERFLPWTLTGK